MLNDDIAIDILNVLIDQYEKSAIFKETTTRNLKIRLDINKHYQNYFRSDSYEYTEKVDAAIEELLDLKTIRKGRVFEVGQKEIELITEKETLKKSYQLLERVQLKNAREELFDFLNNYSSQSHFINNFVTYLLKKMEKYQTFLPYISNQTINNCQDILNILEILTLQQKEISLRKLSIQIFNDSKQLALYEKNLFNIIHDFYDDSVETPDDALAIFNVVKNPTYVYIKGDMIIKVNSQIINLALLNGPFSLTTENINQLEIISIHSSQLITIENLTSFYDATVDDAIIVYLGGFHSHLRRELLLKIYRHQGQRLKYYHFGDIDAGGFYIYLDLISKTKMPFSLYKMDVDTLKKYERFCKPLTINDRRRLNLLKEKFNNSTIDYMLENNVKLEQEIIELK